MWGPKGALARNVDFIVNKVRLRILQPTYVDSIRIPEVVGKCRAGGGEDRSGASARADQ